MEYTNEIQEALGRSYDVPDYIDEDDLLGGGRRGGGYGQGDREMVGP